MATRQRAGGIGIQQFLVDEERGLSSLAKESPDELIASTMAIEGKRLGEFLSSAIHSAEKIVDTGIIPSLKMENWYYKPPAPIAVTKFRLNDDYFKEVFNRRGSKELKEHPGFRWDLILPEEGHSAGLELNGEVYLPHPQNQSARFELSFVVNYDDTLTAFKWLLREWRRPIGQLLRGLPKLELWGNGNPIEGPKDCRLKDPAFLLDFHLTQPSPVENTPNLFALRSHFSPDDTDDEVVITCGVFLSLFDAVYRLTCNRADPDRILKHYHALLPHMPKAPFRSKSVFET